MCAGEKYFEKSYHVFQDRCYSTERSEFSRNFLSKVCRRKRNFIMEEQKKREKVPG